jgi:thymidylate kinase
MAEIGKLIVLEAVDDTALELLSDEICGWLRECGLPVEETREPTYGPAGAQILLARQGRLYFDATSLALLYLADRLDHVERTNGMASALQAGRHVICLHYGLAAVSRLWGQVESDWLCRIDALCRVPDLTLFYDLPVEGLPQEQLRESYLAAIPCLRKAGQEVQIVGDRDARSQISSAGKRWIAKLLELVPPERE